MYKKEYNQVFKYKNENSRLKHDYKSLKNLDYQPDQLQQPYQPQQPDQLQQSDLRTSSGDYQYGFNYTKRLKILSVIKLQRIMWLMRSKKILII